MQVGIIDESEQQERLKELGDPLGKLKGNDCALFVPIIRKVYAKEQNRLSLD
ncbi:MAG: hypothetical protein IKH01_07290 [Prevotella sp.]|nr:hypothetical protein [Prevotella sp.]